jgi:hypothetical protein
LIFIGFLLLSRSRALPRQPDFVQAIFQRLIARLDVSVGFI